MAQTQEKPLGLSRRDFLKFGLGAGSALAMYGLGVSSLFPSLDAVYPNKLNDQEFEAFIEKSFGQLIDAAQLNYQNGFDPRLSIGYFPASGIPANSQTGRVTVNFDPLVIDGSHFYSFITTDLDSPLIQKIKLLPDRSAETGTHPVQGPNFLRVFPEPGLRTVLGETGAEWRNHLFENADLSRSLWANLEIAEDVIEAQDVQLLMEDQVWETNYQKLINLLAGLGRVGVYTNIIDQIGLRLIGPLPIQHTGTINATDRERQEVVSYFSDPANIAELSFRAGSTVDKDVQNGSGLSNFFTLICTGKDGRSLNLSTNVFLSPQDKTLEYEIGFADYQDSQNSLVTLDFPYSSAWGKRQSNAAAALLFQDLNNLFSAKERILPRDSQG